MDVLSDRLCVAASLETEPGRAIADIQRQLACDEPTLVLVFHAPSLDADEMARLVAEAYPGACTVGCTTVGEIGPLGLTEGGTSAVALGGPARAAAWWTPDLSTFHFEQGREIVAACAAGLGRSPGQLSPDRHVLITLTDPFSGAEDRLLAALSQAAAGIPVVGGSAGDGFRFEQTTVWHGGHARQGAGAVVLIEPGVPFRPFAVHHFHATDERVVITGVEPGSRAVEELNGWPAVQEYRRLAGLDSDESVAACVATRSWPLHFGFKVGDDLFLRAVMTVRESGLLLGGAVDEGTVLRVVAEDDLEDATRAGVRQAIDQLGGSPAGLLLFNCAGRLLEARLHGRTDQLWQAMAQAPVAGFSTYGEQWGALQVSLTLTGLAFGQGGEP